MRRLNDGRIYPLTRTRRPEKGLPGNKTTHYFSKAQKAAWAVQQGELCRTHLRQGKITRLCRAPDYVDQRANDCQKPIDSNDLSHEQKSVCTA